MQNFQQHWHGPLMAPAVLCHLVLFPLWLQILFQVQRQEKKEEFISLWLLSFVPYVNGGVIYLHILHCSEGPLETTRR